MNDAAGPVDWRTRAWLTLGATIWLAAIGVGMRAVYRFSETPGDPGQPPAIWPLDSGIPRPTASPVLIMMVHPHCSCTGASLEELARAMVRGRGKAEVYVLFLKPAGLGQEWVKTDLWSRAAEIPGVSVLADDR
ncbi:MAG TPA: RedB protein, partial [Candidatus Polarisedimenticolia bacterium]